MLSLYFKLIGARIRAQMQYKVSFWMELLGFALVTGLEFAAVAILLGRFKAIVGWSIAEVALLYGMTSIAFGLAEMFSRGFDSPFERIMLQGSFDTILTRPLGSFFGVLASEFQLMRLGRTSQGALVLAYVLTYLPFLQMRMAVANRLAAGFDRRGAKQEFCKAPWIAAVTLLVTVAMALPLYLLKLETVPAETAWLPSLFFIAFIFPARLLTGWALSWAQAREIPRHWFFRWTGRLPILPAVAFYMLVVYFTQFTSWNGVWSMYEQHAFLVPVPFFGM